MLSTQSIILIAFAAAIEAMTRLRDPLKKLPRLRRLLRKTGFSVAESITIAHVVWRWQGLAHAGLYSKVKP